VGAKKSKFISKAFDGGLLQACTDTCTLIPNLWPKGPY